MKKIKQTCIKCGMIRAVKDMVLLEDEQYMCFSCWNKYLKKKDN